MAYPFRISSHANQNLGDILDYLNKKVGGVGNPLIALRWTKEFDKTLSYIISNPESYALCEENDLYNKGFRKAHLKHYKYKIFYRIMDDGVVLIDLICHDKQDYEKLL